MQCINLVLDQTDMIRIAASRTIYGSMHRKNRYQNANPHRLALSLIPR